MGRSMKTCKIGEILRGREALVIAIASADKKSLEDECRQAEASGKFPLLKASDAADIAKIRSMRSSLLLLSDEGPVKGKTDKVNPIVTREFVDWECSFIYQASESSSFIDKLAYDEGFCGILQGQAASSPAMVAADENRRGFWTKLFRRRRYTRPLVKIGGITRSQDANLASGLGADILGFDLSYQAEDIIRLINSLPETESVKVVSVPEGDENLYKAASGLVAQGKIDAIEFSGDGTEEAYLPLVGSAYYRKLNILSYDDVKAAGACGEARVMLSSSELNEDGACSLIYSYTDDISRNLWLSGNIGCQNIKKIVKKFRPELVSVSESLNGADGGKDPQLMRAFFKEVLYAK